jgi:hypothetical protein
MECMEEIEKFFKCSYCFEKISMILDPSEEGLQSYIEDCEVCCQPIQISFEVKNGKIKNFHSDKIWAYELVYHDSYWNRNYNKS